MVFQSQTLMIVLHIYINLQKFILLKCWIKTMNAAFSKPRQSWQNQQDKALKHLRQDMKIEKWTEVAEKLTSLYRIQNRNHQQCRDRYVNLLLHNAQKQKWPRLNFQKLIDLYLTYGNKWSEIANHFDKINGLLIKNKFYSRLRKGLRNVNYIIQTYLNETWQKINFNMTFKLINCAANKFDYPEKSLLGKKIERQTTFVQDIIKNVFNISWLDKKELQNAFKSKKIDHFHQEHIDKLISDINLIDENIDKKNSNRKFSKQKPSSHNQVQMKTQKVKRLSKRKKFKKVEKDNIEISCVELSQIAQKQLKKQIQIISVNSYKTIGRMQDESKENQPLRVSYRSQESSEHRKDAQTVGIRYSGYRQLKFQEVNSQANYSAYVKFLEDRHFTEPNPLKTNEACINGVYQN